MDEAGDDDDDDDDESWKPKASKMREQLFDLDDGDDEDEDDWEDFYDYWDDEGDQVVTSPLDAIDAHVYFSDSLGAMQANEAERFNAMLAGMQDAKQRQLLEETMQYANERRQALAQAQAQAAQPAS